MSGSASDAVGELRRPVVGQEGLQMGFQDLQLPADVAGGLGLFGQVDRVVAVPQQLVQVLALDAD